jgi:mono/diheme cytochrome c family protein/uncharacterized membrane protein
MRRYWWLAAATLIAFTGTWPRAAQAQAAARARDSGREVLAVFSAKCAVCHGPDLRKPKGHFGYILDLKQLASDPEKVIPPNPQDSDLWGLVERNEMPPADSPCGALTMEQKESIRTWIAAGAPDALPVVAKPPANEPSNASAAVPSDPASTAPPKLSPAYSTVGRFLLWLGKFHLLLLHFPIALVIAAGITEILSCLQQQPKPSGSAGLCLWLAALAAIPTAGFGWLFAAAGNGARLPQLLTAHRWLGTTAAVWLAFTAVAAQRDARRGRRSNFVRLLLTLGILMTAITAHLGGLLAHGTDFFDY